MPLNKNVVELSPLIFLSHGNPYDYSSSTDIVFKYFSEAFLSQNSTDPSSVEWQYIEDNFNMLSHNGRKLNPDVQKPFEKEILKNAWIQWATLIQNNFNQSFVKDINVALAAIKCYVIASKLTNNIKCNTIVAKVCICITLQ